jgi:uncharacterized protein
MRYESFPVEVKARLGWYVYRLIDPRNGETFYVGKGRDDRVFEHARSAFSASGEEDALDLKVQRIKEIIGAGFEVAHVIHRHGIETAEIAYEIEGALIDAYPGLANRVGGHRSGDYGVRHVDEIIDQLTAQPFVPREPLILISVAKSFGDKTKDIYDATRGCWVIKPERARNYKLVLAHRGGTVIEAFRPKGEWLKATKANFPWLEEDELPRWGFVGEVAEGASRDYYRGKRVPDQYRAKGAANPIRFVDPPAAT